ncbi:hypothetical protein UFOVP13_19 [uncultured Caudovirales phage]|uniref:Transcriptional repressor NrdR-like N-terminal domain-containing protein n=1 Tax=uncultured Caudovirales phage TaxID=2100421 RepID=A0A6J5KH30_9CAUD|nr:hypothetical protein UFOVP13_19 [uncultured Caudovirales phage]
MNPVMLCPKCHAPENRLLRLTQHKKHNYLRRRRVCKACEYRWNTLEIVEKEIEIEEQEQ